MTFTHYAVIASALLLALALIWFGIRGLRDPEKSRVYIWNGGAPFALLTGIVILWGMMWIILQRATHGRVNINKWWFQPESAGFWWGMLSPIMLMLMLAVCLLWWWPSNTRSFVRALKTREGRVHYLWELGASATAFLAAVATLTLGMWLILKLGSSLTTVGWIIGPLLAVAAWGAAIGVSWLYARLIPNPRGRRLER